MCKSKRIESEKGMKEYTLGDALFDALLASGWLRPGVGMCAEPQPRSPRKKVGRVRPVKAALLAYVAAHPGADTITIAAAHSLKVKVAGSLLARIAGQGLLVRTFHIREDANISTWTVPEGGGTTPFAGRNPVVAGEP